MRVSRDAMSTAEHEIAPLGTAGRLAGSVLSRVYNWHWIEPGLARSAQAYGRHIPLLLRHHGIRSVINLRGDNAGSPWYDNERRAAAGLGIAYVDVQLSSKRLPDRDSLLAVIDAVRDAPRPALIKCSGGADRTGFVAGLHLLESRGRVALPKARRQTNAWPYFHLPKPHQRWIRAFFDFYAADAPNQSLRDWLRTGYEAGRFAGFLDGRGQHNAWKRD